MSLDLVFAFIVGVLAVARLTRLLVDDDWPPIVWVRDKYLDALVRLFHADGTNDEAARKAHDWYQLVECPFCASTWFALANLGLAWWSYNGDGQLDWWWWLPNLWFAGMYLAAMINVRDIPPEE
jgi:Protein of unknown function (DUF1360)